MELCPDKPNVNQKYRKSKIHLKTSNLPKTIG